MWKSQNSDTADEEVSEIIEKREKSDIKISEIVRRSQKSDTIDEEVSEIIEKGEKTDILMSEIVRKL